MAGGIRAVAGTVSDQLPLYCRFPSKQSENCHFFRHVLSLPTFQTQPLIIKRQLSLLLSYGNPQWDKWAFLHQSDGLIFILLPQTSVEIVWLGLDKAIALGHGNLLLNFEYCPRSLQVDDTERPQSFRAVVLSLRQWFRMVLHWILQGHKRQPGPRSGTWVSLLIIPHPCKSHLLAEIHLPFHFSLSVD